MRHPHHLRRQRRRQHLRPNPTADVARYLAWLRVNSEARAEIQFRAKLGPGWPVHSTKLHNGRWVHTSVYADDLDIIELGALVVLHTLHAAQQEPAVRA